MMFFKIVQIGYVIRTVNRDCKAKNFIFIAYRFKVFKTLITQVLFGIYLSSTMS